MVSPAPPRAFSLASCLWTSSRVLLPPGTPPTDANAGPMITAIGSWLATANRKNITQSIHVRGVGLACKTMWCVAQHWSGEPWYKLCSAALYINHITVFCNMTQYITIPVAITVLIMVERAHKLNSQIQTSSQSD